MNAQNSDAVSGSLSRALYFPKTQDNTPAFKVSVFADIVQVKSLRCVIKPHSQANKNRIHGFSAQSRHAMIEFLAKIVDVPDLFVTLTYSDDIADDWYLTLKRNFEAFRKQMEYHYPDIRAMWRVEFVPRKSGRLYGMFIPHVHLLVWLPKDISEWRRELILKNDGELWRKAWHSITGSANKEHLRLYGCKVEPIRSRKHSYSYCSKYLAKETYEDIEYGRRWGRIGHFEQPAFTTELTRTEYRHFKRLMNAYVKANALKRFHNQKIKSGMKKLPRRHYTRFSKAFRRLSVYKGSSVFGLGFISQFGSLIYNGQEPMLEHLTIFRMIEHARHLAQTTIVHDNDLSTA